MPHPPVPLPRVLVAAPASGQGKTTVATGLMAALAARGLAVAPAKVGPDYVDPGFHALATGRPGRNLDPWLTSEELLAPLLLHGAGTPSPADVAVVEGVMGLFDGRLGTEGFASSAHVARLTGTPVLLVVDAAASSRTVGAVVAGMVAFEPGLRVGGVVLNRVASGRHEAEVRAAVESVGVPVVGALHHDEALTMPSRHLGLVPAAERAEAVGSVRAIGEAVARGVDLDAVLAVARSAPALDVEPWSPQEALAEAGWTPYPPGSRPVVAVAGGAAFTFRYAETTELLEAAGCTVVEVDPLGDAALPAEVAGIYLGGGFPEVHAERLAGNTAFLGSLRAAVGAGVPTVAECAGMLYLARSQDGRPMAGVLPTEATMRPGLRLGYDRLVAPVDSVLGPAGTRVTSHEFHRTGCDPAAADGAGWLVGDDGRADGFALDPAGTGRATVHAAYPHVHWAGHPRLAASFARAVYEGRARR